MFDFKSGYLIKFYLSTIFKANKDKTKIVYDLDMKVKISLLLVVFFEVFKNLVLVIMPMSNDLRFIV